MQKFLSCFYFSFQLFLPEIFCSACRCYIFLHIVLLMVSIFYSKFYSDVHVKGLFLKIQHSEFFDNNLYHLPICLIPFLLQINGIICSFSRLDLMISLLIVNSVGGSEFPWKISSLNTSLTSEILCVIVLIIDQYFKLLRRDFCFYFSFQIAFFTLLLLAIFVALWFEGFWYYFLHNSISTI